MSQFNIRSLREIPNSPNDKFVNTLAKRLSKFLNKDQTDKLEGKEDIYSAAQDTESVVKVHDLSSTKYFDFNRIYYPPTEPDGVKLRLWLRGYNIGNTLKDWSATPDKICTIHGDPLLMDGTPFDLGIHTGGVKSTCLRFNRPTSELVNQEYLVVDETPTLTLENLTIGKSYFIRFRVSNLESQGGFNRRLFEKTDGITLTSATMLQVTPTGKLVWVLKRGGVEHKVETDSSTIALDTVYDVWLTYANSGNVQKIYVNNVDKTLSTFAGDANWHNDLTDSDLYIFRRGKGVDSGHVEGDLYDFRIYHEKVVTSNPIGTSILFDGSNDYIQCGNESTLWSQTLSKFSFSFWIYPTNIDATDRWVAGNGRFEVYIYESAGVDKIRFLCKNAVNTQIVASSNITANQWNYVTCVYDNSLGSANVKIYVETVIGSVTGNLTETLTAGTNFTLSASSADFAGYMSDVRWWTTKALTQSEITKVYNFDRTAPAPDYYLPMGDGVGNPLDVISETKTGALTNGASWITDEVGNMYLNKWTTAYIQFGQVMVSNYWATYGETSSFESDSFESDSFEV